jgi:hypothetical protein
MMALLAARPELEERHGAGPAHDGLRRRAAPFPEGFEPDNKIVDLATEEAETASKPAEAGK